MGFEAEARVVLLALVELKFVNVQLATVYFKPTIKKLIVYFLELFNLVFALAPLLYKLDLFAFLHVNLYLLLSNFLRLQEECVSLFKENGAIFLLASFSEHLLGYGHSFVLLTYFFEESLLGHLLHDFDFLGQRWRFFHLVCVLCHLHHRPGYLPSHEPGDKHSEDHHHRQAYHDHPDADVLRPDELSKQRNLRLLHLVFLLEQDQVELDLVLRLCCDRHGLRVGQVCLSVDRIAEDLWLKDYSSLLREYLFCHLYVRVWALKDPSVVSWHYDALVIFFCAERGVHPKVEFLFSFIILGWQNWFQQPWEVQCEELHLEVADDAFFFGAETYYTVDVNSITK